MCVQCVCVVYHQAKQTPVFRALCDVLNDAISSVKSVLNRDAADKYEKVTWTHCFLGATAWYRMLDASSRARANAFLNALEANITLQLQQPGSLNVRMTWGMVLGHDEAKYEWKAVEYGLRQAYLNPPMGQEFHQPSVLLTGGSGSVQVTGFDSFFSFNAPLEDGARVVHEPGQRTPQTLAAWTARVEEALNAKKGTLPQLLASAAERAQTEGCVLEDRVHPERSVRAISVVIISAFFYVALKAGILAKGDPYRYVTASEACDKLEALFNGPAASAKDVANAVRLHTLLKTLFDSGDAEGGATSHLDHVECLFARDWTLNAREEPIGVAEANFRFTWT